MRGNMRQSVPVPATLANARQPRPSRAPSPALPSRRTMSSQPSGSNVAWVRQFGPETPRRQVGCCGVPAIGPTHP